MVLTNKHKLKHKKIKPVLKHHCRNTGKVGSGNSRAEGELSRDLLKSVVVGGGGVENERLSCNVHIGRWQTINQSVSSPAFSRSAFYDEARCMMPVAAAEADP